MVSNDSTSREVWLLLPHRSAATCQLRCAIARKGAGEPRLEDLLSWKAGVGLDGSEDLRAAGDGAAGISSAAMMNEIEREPISASRPPALCRAPHPARTLRAGDLETLSE